MAEAQYLLGMVQDARQRPDEALAAFAEVLRLNPRASAAQVQLSRLNLEKGRRNTALQYAQSAASAQPNDPVTQLTLARSLLANGEVDRANQVLTSLVAAQPKVATVHVLLGVVAANRRDEAGARRHFADALALEPDNLEALSSLVTLDLSGHQLQAARARVDERVARSPKDSGALLLAGRVHAINE